jgi:phosphate transport system protein
METQTRHILGTFDNALGALRNDVLMMASLTERNLRNAMQGLLERDSDLSNLAIADDEEIDLLEKQVDQTGIELLLRFQPVASDLRQVISAMKLSGNLERIADQAVNISKRARKLNQNAALEDVHYLEPLFNEALGIFKDSMRAFIDGDVDLALAVKARDKKLDGANAEVANRLTARMVELPERITDFLNLLLIARHLERVGDHSKNIAEDAVYAAAAEDIRHSRAQNPAAAQG